MCFHEPGRGKSGPARRADTTLMAGDRSGIGSRRAPCLGVKTYEGPPPGFAAAFGGLQKTKEAPVSPPFYEPATPAPEMRVIAVRAIWSRSGLATWASAPTLSPLWRSSSVMMEE